MTKKELSQIFYLKKEIQELKCRIAELQTLANGSTSKITDIPHSKEISDKVGKNVVKIIDLQDKLQDKISEYIEKFDKINNFINKIDDSQIRLILNLRYIKCLSWQRIAFKIGKHDEQYPRRKHNNFLLKNYCAK